MDLESGGTGGIVFAIEDQVSGRDDEHGQHHRNSQSADDGPGQRRVGLAAGAQLECHRNAGRLSVASEVISTGRSRTRQASDTASRNGRPSSRSRLVNSTIRMLLETTMPTIITTPISDMTFSVVPVSQQDEQHSGQPGRHRQQNQQRIHEGLELRDQDQINQQRRQDQPQPETA